MACCTAHSVGCRCGRGLGVIQTGNQAVRHWLAMDERRYGVWGDDRLCPCRCLSPRVVVPHRQMGELPCRCLFRPQVVGPCRTPCLERPCLSLHAPLRRETLCRETLCLANPCRREIPCREKLCLCRGRDCPRLGWRRWVALGVLPCLCRAERWERLGCGQWYEEGAAEPGSSCWQPVGLCCPCWGRAVLSACEPSPSRKRAGAKYWPGGWQDDWRADRQGENGTLWGCVSRWLYGWVAVPCSTGVGGLWTTSGSGNAKGTTCHHS
mmetsp:Transcript_13399/g.31989  ORF Transcript_13399/g.31989 Transcript_13399/m.31989 type:complete len:266 (-) Transcript_13399:80-877(-)